MIKEFINGLRIIKMIGENNDFDTLQRGLGMMNSVKLGRIAQLSGTLSAQVEHNRNLLAGLEELKKTHEATEAMAQYLLDLKI